MSADSRFPKMIMVEHPGKDGEVIVVRRGEMGYYPYPGKTLDDARAYNERHGATPAVVEAMLTGSMFGWDCPAARYPEED